MIGTLIIRGAPWVKVITKNSNEIENCLLGSKPFSTVRPNVIIFYLVFMYALTTTLGISSQLDEIIVVTGLFTFHIHILKIMYNL